MRGVFQQSTGNAKALLLAAGNVSAALVNVGVVFIGEALNKFIGASLLACLLDLGIGGILIAPAQVFGNGTAEQFVFLQHHGNAVAQDLQAVIAYIHAANVHMTGGGIIQAGQQLAPGWILRCRCRR